MAFKFKMRSPKQRAIAEAIVEAEYAAKDQLIANLRDIGWTETITLATWDRRFCLSIVNNYTICCTSPTPKQLVQIHRILCQYGEEL